VNSSISTFLQDENEKKNNHVYYFFHSYLLTHTIHKKKNKSSPFPQKNGNVLKCLLACPFFFFYLAAASLPGQGFFVVITHPPKFQKHAGVFLKAEWWGYSRGA
jgi:hypothetical protein